MSQLAAFHVDHLEKRCKGFTLRMTFQLAHGEVLALVGANGAGKTTLIYCLLRLAPWETGCIFLFGLDLERKEVTLESHVGFLENAPLFAETRVRDLLAVFAGFYPTWNWKLAEQVIERFEVNVNKSKSPPKG